MRERAALIILGLLIIFQPGCRDRSNNRTHSTASPQGKMLLQLDRAVDRQSDEIKQLEALGYLGGHEESYGPAGVLIHDPLRAWEGCNLIVSGHSAVVDLVTMDGHLIHRWQCPRNEAFKGLPLIEGDNRSKSFRRAYPLPNGDLVGIFNGTGMVRLDQGSRVLWAQPAMCHHDLTFGPDGTIFTFVQTSRLFPEFNPDEKVYDETIAQINPDSGQIFKQVSLIEAFYHSPFASWLKKIPTSGDIFHANTITWIGDVQADLKPIYQPGHLLISLRNMDAIVILDPQTGTISWVMAGLWSFQHEPSILPDGNILLFDNAGHYGRSKVIIVDPMTQAIVWSYTDSPGTPLFSSTSGGCHQLPNGNILIIESNRGRAFETVPDGSIVWEFINPNRWGENGQMTATIFDVQRLPADFFGRNINCTPNNHNSGTSHTR